MLRLAHQILSQKPLVPSVIDKSAEPAYLQQYRMVQILIGSSACHTIIADNVARYYADTPKQDWTLNGKNFPCIAPPFETAWFIEWKEPGYLIGPNGKEEVNAKDCPLGGALLMNIPFDVARNVIFKKLRVPKEQVEASLSESKWLLTSQHLGMVKGRIVLMPFMQLIFVTKTGEFLRRMFTSTLLNPDDPRSVALMGDTASLLHIPLLTTGFLHCKNVSQVNVTKEEGPPSGWCKRKRLPSIAYHTILIDPNLGSKPRSGERKTEGDRSGKALHICRGYFMHCINDGVNKGLFGRGIYGTFWVPSHVRGSADLGRVIPTYNVLAPTVQQSA